MRGSLSKGMFFVISAGPLLGRLTPALQSASGSPPLHPMDLPSSAPAVDSLGLGHRRRRWAPAGPLTGAGMGLGLLLQLATLTLAGLAPLSSLPARAFDVFCVANGDGTSTCEGWRGGETLTCVGSPGGVSTCSVPSGRRFTCTLSLGGATTCADNPANRPDTDGTNCTFTGDGNFVCTPPPPRSQPLLPGPALPPLQDRPDFPPMAPVITNPSVF